MSNPFSLKAHNQLLASRGMTLTRLELEYEKAIEAAMAREPGTARAALIASRPAIRFAQWKLDMATKVYLRRAREGVDAATGCRIVLDAVLLTTLEAWRKGDKLPAVV